MANKMTKKDYFQILRDTYPTDLPNYAEVIAFIDHEVELLSKKSGSSKKPTKQQEANEEIKEAILATMTPHRPYSIAEIQKEVAECNELSNQKVSALMKQLKDDGKVIRTEDKRKAYFEIALAPVEDVED